MLAQSGLYVILLCPTVLTLFALDQICQTIDNNNERIDFAVNSDTHILLGVRDQLITLGIDNDSGSITSKQAQTWSHLHGQYVFGHKFEFCCSFSGWKKVPIWLTALLHKNRFEFDLYLINYNKITQQVDIHNNLDKYFPNTSRNGFTFKGNCHLRQTTRTEITCSNTVLYSKTRKELDEQEIREVLVEGYLDQNITYRDKLTNELNGIKFYVYLNNLQTINLFLVRIGKVIKYCFDECEDSYILFDCSNYNKVTKSKPQPNNEIIISTIPRETELDSNENENDKQIITEIKGLRQDLTIISVIIGLAIIALFGLVFYAIRKITLNKSGVTDEDENEKLRSPCQVTDNLLVAL